MDQIQQLQRTCIILRKSKRNCNWILVSFAKRLGSGKWEVFNARGAPEKTKKPCHGSYFDRDLSMHATRGPIRLMIQSLYLRREVTAKQEIWEK
jgi:hypothetical protein